MKFQKMTTSRSGMNKYKLQTVIYMLFCFRKSDWVRHKNEMKEIVNCI